MGKFADKTLQAVRVEGDPHTIWIKSRMNFGDKTELQARLAGTDRAHLLRMNQHLLEINIVKWEGPEFDGVPVNAETIAALDPDEPLIGAAIAKILVNNPAAPTGGATRSTAGAAPLTLAEAAAESGASTS